MSQNQHPNLALFIDFDNVAIGSRDARQRFDVKLLLQRVLEKGKIIVKRAYADWHYYKEYMTPLHEAAIELIEIPMPRISGKNSADIRLVVDAMDLCYSKDHIDTFVIVSGDSDFSPLVSKLRENNKRVIGIGVKNSSSHLLISNCDEFIFYDDIYRQAVGQLSKNVGNVPADKRALFDFLVQTAQGLLQESRGVLYSSLIKDTMTRKQPDFNERAYGYANFGELLEDARNLGLLKVERDARAGGTWVVQGLGEGLTAAAGEAAADANGKSRGGRRRRRSGRGRETEGGKAATPAEQADSGSRAGTDAPAAATAAQDGKGPQDSRAAAPAAADQAGTPAGTTRKSSRGKRSRKKTATKAEPAAADRTDAVPPAKTAETPPAAEGAGTAAKPTGRRTTSKASTKKTAKKTAKKTTKTETAAKTTKKAATGGDAGKKTAKKTTRRRPAKKTGSGGGGDKPSGS
ncbi:MAG: NYN domain-containing protein [Candidatus Krumholzibacteriia bacterium]